MNPIILHPKDDAEWLQWKSEDISSTEVAALYNKSPYATAFSLYHEKAGLLEKDELKSKRAFWGKIYEAPTAEAIAKMYGVIVRPMKEYMRHGETPRMGASFDYEIIGLADDWNPEMAQDKYNANMLRDKFIESGPGILEIKLVDYFVHKKEWTEEEAPLHIEFQVQQQLEICRRNWTALVASVIGYDIHILLRDRDEDFGRRICKKITKFWDMVAKQTPPQADYSEDSDIIKKIYAHNLEDQAIDFGDNMDFQIACRKFLRAGELRKKLEKIEDAAKAQITDLIKNAPAAVSHNYAVKFSEVKASPPTIITMDMIGSSYGGRSGYRRITVKKIG